MADLAQHLEAVEAALYSGTLSVQYEDKRVTYQSAAELRRLRDDLKTQLEGPRRTLLYPTFDRGLER